MKGMMKKTILTITVLSLLSIGLALSGCGGGSGSGGGEVSTQIIGNSDGVKLSSQIVSGTVSAGAPLAGQISIKDSSAAPQVKTSVIGNDGSFAFDVSDMTSPYILQAKGSVNGTEYTLHSYAKGTGHVSVSPLSNAVLAIAAEVDDPEYVYENDDFSTRDKIELNLPETVDSLLNTLQLLIEQYYADNTKPIMSGYIMKHLDLDDMFEDVKITVKNGNLSIINEKTNTVIYTGKISDIENGNFYPDNIPPAPAVPAAPVGVTATGGSGQITLAWTAVSDATSYNIYYSIKPKVTTASGTKIQAATNNYIHTGLTAGTTYEYIVTAVNSAGESLASAQVSAVTNPDMPVTTLPAAPTGVKAVGGTKQTAISWSAVSGATSYNLYWSTTSGVTTANGIKIAGATSPAVHTGLSDSTSYYYVITAVNSVGESDASIQVAATTLTPAPAPTAPAVPTGVSATGGANKTTISWTAVSGATSYNLYWLKQSGVTTATGTKITGATSPYVQTGLTDSTAYYYIVTAGNSSGESAASAQVTATTNAAAPSLVCSNCHIAIPPTTGKHSLHSAYSCAICHGSGYSTTTVNLTTHMNGVVNISSGIGWNATSRSCSPSCHGLKNW